MLQIAIDMDLTLQCLDGPCLDGLEKKCPIGFEKY